MKAKKNIRLHMMVDVETMGYLKATAKAYEDNISQAARTLIREGYVAVVTRAAEPLPFDDAPLAED